MKFRPFSHRPVNPDEAAEGFEQILKVLNDPNAEIPEEEKASKVIKGDFSNLPPIDDEDPRIKDVNRRKDLDLR